MRTITGFNVNPAKRSGDAPFAVPKYAGGSMTASRSFRVPCRNAQEFAFRQMGRYYEAGLYEDPWLPAEFPWDADDNTEMPRMVAIGFDITPVAECCFHAGLSEETQSLVNTESWSTMERYYYTDAEVGEGASNSECDCLVRIDYANPPWNCVDTDFEIGTLLQHTAIRVRRTSGYELFTVPTRSLVWDDLPDGADKQLKGDSNATILIPKADISIEWFNIPTRYLCQVGSHLDAFRNTVNQEVFGDFLDCESYSETSGSAATCNDYEAETMLFVDWEEIEQYRTNCFRFMDSTAIRIRIKQKRIVDPVDSAVKGWNHLYSDRTRGDTPTGKWMRVKQQGVGAATDLFKIQSWANLLNPTLT